VSTCRLIYRNLLLAMCLFFAGKAVAATYTIPSGPLPPGCSFNAAQATVLCSGNLILGNNDSIVVSAATTLQIGSDFTFGNNFRVNIGGDFSDLSILVGGNLNPGNGAVINASLAVQGNINAMNNAEIDGPIVVSGNLMLGNNSVVTGGIDVSGDFNTGQNVTINGTVQASNVNLGQNNEINGSIVAVNVNINGNNTVVDGNINATGSVNNNGLITGYVNAPTINNNGQILGPTCNQNNNVGGCNGGGPVQPDHYRLIHSASALTCENEPVVILACQDQGCSATLAITGQVSVQAQGPMQVAANATFLESGQSSVALPLTSPGAYTLSVSAADVPSVSAHQCQSPNGCTMTAVDTALRFGEIGAQVAAEPFQAQLQIVRTDNNTGACQLVAETIDEVELALSCMNPAQCAANPAQSNATYFSAQSTAVLQHPDFNAIAAAFDAQPAITLSLNHLDVGQVRVHARAQLQNGTTLAGVSNPFIVRPAGFTVALSNDNVYPGGIFARAGDPLQVQIQAVNASGAVTPSFGSETPPQTPTLASTAQTISPEQGIDGSVMLHGGFTLSAPGVFSSADVRYTEAGTARFEALLETPLYLGSGPVSSSWSDPVGRFVPYEFHLQDSPMSLLTPACSAGLQPFTYLGQAFSVDGEILAQNYLGELTLNYPDTGTGAPMQFLAFDSDEERDLSERLSPDVITPSWQNGVGSMTAAQLTLERDEDGSPEAPIANLQLAILPDPLTAVGAAVPMAGADTSESGPDCLIDQLCNAREFASPQRWVYGRLLLSNTYGSEFDNVPIIASAQFWNGERFILQRDDSCTLVGPDDITITDNPDELVVQAIGTEVPLREGDSVREELGFSAPNQSGEIRFELAVPPWLGFGGNDNTDLPSATATFGTYAGHDRIHSWQEIYNRPSLD